MCMCFECAYLEICVLHGVLSSMLFDPACVVTCIWTSPTYLYVMMNAAWPILHMLPIPLHLTNISDYMGLLRVVAWFVAISGQPTWFYSGVCGPPVMSIINTPHLHGLSLLIMVVLVGSHIIHQWQWHCHSAKTISGVQTLTQDPTLVPRCIIRRHAVYASWHDFSPIISFIGQCQVTKFVILL